MPRQPIYVSQTRDIESVSSEKTKIYPSHISNTLNELVEKKLVVCLTPKLKKGRLYELTKNGYAILDIIT